MNISLNISISDSARPALEALSARNRVNLADVAAKGVAKAVIENFAGLPSNKKGWPTTQFWKRAGKSVRVRETGQNSADVDIEQIGVNQRWKGGRIPRAGDADPLLSIPARAEAYGKAARDIPGLKISYYFKNGALHPVLVMPPKKRKGAKRAKPGQAKPRPPQKVYFWLKKSVMQTGNAAVMPSRDKITAAGARRLAAYVEMLVDRERP